MDRAAPLSLSCLEEERPFLLAEQDTMCSSKVCRMFLEGGVNGRDVAEMVLCV